MWINSRKFLRHSKKIIFLKKNKKINFFHKITNNNRLKSIKNSKLTPHKPLSIKSNQFNIINYGAFKWLDKISLYYSTIATHYNYNLNKYYSLTCSDLGFIFLTPLIAQKHRFDNKFFSNFHKLGNTVGLPLRVLKSNIIVCNLNSFNSNYSNSQGTYSIIKKVHPNYSVITLPSGKTIQFKGSFYLGKNFSQKNKNYRHKNIILSVRGVAKNPVDHPNGGRSNTKGSLKTPWGKYAKASK